MCDQCNIARDFAQYAMFNPSCIYCGARILRQWATYPIGQEECTARRRASLKVWTDWGHSEAEIRRLFKNGPVIGSDVATASDNPTLPKPTSRKRK